MVPRLPRGAPVSSIRVIAGRFGGRLLDAPRENNTRTKPMGERIRNAMFNSIGNEINGAQVLDAFAGTGAVGLEALSRGAARVTFIERDKIAQKILSNNVSSLGVQNEAKIISAPVNSWIESGSAGKYDIIFADPPYKNPQFSTVSKLFGLLKPGGLMVLSHPGRGEEPNLGNEIVVVDNRSYGNAYLTSFRRESCDS
ncbi:16S rRNA (guanine(966)-N(2))-methyltransferase RsmD [TM7 phylum sp. oral taxon 346]|nr:16S rRNA (guanine(966)-N(2))-methyltransferase RsmD [TM7 phylum sp. oral taxon 346]